MYMDDFSKSALKKIDELKNLDSRIESEQLFREKTRDVLNAIIISLDYNFKNVRMWLELSNLLYYYYDFIEEPVKIKKEFNAEQAFWKAIKITEFYEKLGRRDKVIEIFNWIKQVAPRNYLIDLGYKYCYLKKRDHEKALQLLNHAVSISNSNPRIGYADELLDNDESFIYDFLLKLYMAEIHEDLNHFDKSIEIYEDCSSDPFYVEYPEYSRMLYNLSRLYRKNGNYEKSIEILTKLLEQKQFFGDNLHKIMFKFELGLVHEHMGENYTALKHFFNTYQSTKHWDLYNDLNAASRKWCIKFFDDLSNQFDKINLEDINNRSSLNLDEIKSFLKLIIKEGYLNAKFDTNFLVFSSSQSRKLYEEMINQTMSEMSENLKLKQRNKEKSNSCIFNP